MILKDYFSSLYGQKVTAGAVTGSRVGWPFLARGSVLTSTITPRSRNFSTLGMAIIHRKDALMFVMFRKKTKSRNG